MKYSVKMGNWEEVIDDVEMEGSTKLGTAVATPWVVCLVCRDARSCGAIIDCHPQQDVPSALYFSIVVTAATLLHPLFPQTHVEVYLWDGQICNGKVVACDFHYNLAAVRIETKGPLQTSTLRCLDDVVSFRPSPTPRPQFEPRPHSNLFKIVPGTKIATLWRSFNPDQFSVYSGVFGFISSDIGLDCNELYWVKGSQQLEHSGESVINSSGELIGIAFYNYAFLPINIVSKWWEHFKSCGKYRRPWLGVEVFNLHSCSMKFLEEFLVKFPNVSTAVVVSKVAKDSPAYCSGIHPKDVIVECSGKSICSKLEFFAMMWDMVGESIELGVLRASTGEMVKLRVTVGETAPEDFYKWP